MDFNNKPKISFSLIMPTYNREHHLSNAIDSVLAQTYQNFELIIVDDGSSDNTESLIEKKYAPQLSSGQIKYIRLSQNAGVSHARNIGLKFCANQWIAYIDSDNAVRQNFLEVFAGAIRKHPLKKLFYAQCQYVNSRKILGEKTNFKRLIRSGNTVDLGVFVHHRRLFEKLGGFDEQLTRFVDYDVILKYFKAASGSFISEIVLDYNDDDNINRISLREDCSGNLQKIWLKWLKYAPVSKKTKQLWSLQAKEQSANKPQTVISLTSYPARINTVHLTIQTLLEQTVKADKVILYLGYEQFPHREKDLPKQLTSLTGKGLSIEWCHNMLSYKKLIPALQQYPEALIVTADDDLLYAPDWLEKLLVSYEKNPMVIHCHRAHEVTFKKRRLASYMKWNWEIKTAEACFNNFATGCGGVLYPPHCLYKDVCDEQKFMSLAPRADDVWFWAMAVMNGTKVKVVENNQSELNYVSDTQDSDNCLYKSNTGDDCQNDVFIKNVLKVYPAVLKRLKRIQSKSSFLRTKYYLFAVMPILEIREKADRRTGLLFGVPLFKQKKNAGTTTCYVCGIPFLKIRRE